MQYAIRTFGCQMNYSDSERVAQVLEQCGFLKTENEDFADFLVVNTCSVRQKSEDKAYGFIVQKKKENPTLKVAVTGCMVRQTGDRDISKDELLKYDPIDLVFRIEDTARLPKLIEKHFPRHDFSDFSENFGIGSIENYFNIVPKIENKTQVFVPIMQGCDKFCAYCIVPYTRGRESSRPMADILKECETHVENGAKEITLLGQNVNSYKDGENEKKCFSLLLQKVDALHEKGLSRLRFTSAHPQDFTPEVIDVLSALKTRCPYIHLPAQHGSDKILRAMNRNYTSAHFRKTVQEIREKMPDTVLATDIIVGFPGETKDDFQELCDFAMEMKFDFSYTAIFSPRKNTPAEKMTENFVDINEKKRRFHCFDEIVKKTAFSHRAEFLEKTLEILVEKSEPAEKGGYRNSGRSREFFEVSFVSGRSFRGKIVPVRITKQKGYVLNGEAEEGNTGLPIINYLQK